MLHFCHQFEIGERKFCHTNPTPQCKAMSVMVVKCGWLIYLFYPVQCIYVYLHHIHHFTGLNAIIHSEFNDPA